MCCYVLVAFLITTVFCLEVQIITANNDGVLHLGGLDHARDQLTPDVDAASPRALLVDVRALDSGPRRLDAQTNLLVVAGLPDTRLLGAKHALFALEDAVLLLVATLVLLHSRGDARGRHDGRRGLR